VAKARPPRYLEIADELRTRLTRSAAGDPIPSETDLAERFGVSRMTARQAVQSLASEGLVYRIKGSGTFASGTETHRTMGVLRSFTEEMLERDITVTSTVLSAEWITPELPLLAELNLAPGSRAVQVIRVRLGNGEPLAVETVALTPRCSFVLDFDLSNHSLHQLLQERDIVPTTARGTLVATVASMTDATRLDVPTGSAILVERRRIDDQHNERIESTETRYVGSRYVFDVALTKR
jgi:GntR family transcriptional regulator